MIFGMTTFTFVHVALSLIGILAGFVVVFGLLTSRRLVGWTLLFLAATVATSVTGFGFPFDHLLPSHIVGIISLIVLAFAILALYVFRLARAWRWIYVLTAVLALYLNVFVLIVQAFLKVPALHALAPTQNESPFAIAQGAALVAFIILGSIAVKRFHLSVAIR
ncbi:MAG: hypothetical protein P4L92_13715 [Rudaea sp.]|nr:hypothetical protein [Rudaea sp.]